MIIKTIKSSPTAQGREILIPGEPEIRTREERLRSGIPIPDNTWRATMKLAKKYGLDLDKIVNEEKLERM